jgi:hypothetical protein
VDVQGRLQKIQSSLHHRHLNPQSLQRLHHVRRNAFIRDHLLNVFQPADAAKTPLAEFAGVGQHDGFLGRGDHAFIEAGFHHVGGGEAEFGVNAIHTQKKLAAGKIGQHFFRIGAGNGRRGFADYAGQLDHFNALLLYQFQGHLQGGGDDGEVANGLDVAGKRKDRGAGGNEDAVVGFDEARGGGGDAFFFGGVELCFFIHRPVGRIGVAHRGAAMCAVEEPFVFQQFQVFADGDRRDG